MKALIGLLAVLVVSPTVRGEVLETRATLRQHALNLINRDRAFYNLPPVELDLAASEIGDAYCREQIRTRSTGHFSTSGLSPYMRYSFAGGDHGISENAAAWSAKYSFNERALYEMVRRTQDAMMAETPPRDGHKKAILDPHATHAGIGLAWEGGEFRLVHLFVRRYLDWTQPLPRSAHLNQEAVGRGRSQRGTTIEAISVHFEPLPVPMSAQRASAFDTYSLPSNRRDYPARSPHQQSPAEGSIQMARRQGSNAGLRLSETGDFTFRVPFTDGPGIYTVVVWVRRDDDATPIAASNVSIRVESTLQGRSPASAFGR
jgi:hypothetical protein